MGWGWSWESSERRREFWWDRDVIWDFWEDMVWDEEREREEEDSRRSTSSSRREVREVRRERVSLSDFRYTNNVIRKYKLN